MRMIGLVPAVIVVVGALACSDGGDGGDGGVEPDGARLVRAFQAEAEDAAESGEELSEGGVETGCFVLDRQGVVAVADALGVDEPDRAELDGRAFLLGPEGESIGCTIETGDDAPVNVMVSAVSVDRDGWLRDLRRAAGSDTELRDIDGDAPGLHADHVVAVNSDLVATFAWVHDGFAVTMTVLPEAAEPEAGLQALPVLVDAVAASLTGS
jgi:hypothetical protein